jgi:hypothetical protein
MSSESRRWLTEVAIREGFPPAHRLQPFQPPPLPNFISSSERDEVQMKTRKLLAELRTEKQQQEKSSKSVTNLLRSKKGRSDSSQWKFDENEKAEALNDVLHQLLDSVAEAKSQLSIAQSLIDDEHTEVLVRRWAITRSKFRKSIEDIQIESPSDWLRLAAENNNYDLVNLLASRQHNDSDCAINALHGYGQQALNDAFAICLARHSDHAIAQLLLSYGADPNTCSTYFLNAVESFDINIVKLFLQAANRLQVFTVSIGFSHAVRGSNKELITLLLAYGADCNEAKADALHFAIQTENVGVMAAILGLSEGGVTPYNLDRAVSAVLCEKPNDLNIRVEVLKLLLVAGATRNTTLLQQQLAQAVVDRDVNMVKLLILYRTSPDWNAGASIQTAVQNKSFDIIDILLQGQISGESASAALTKIPWDGKEVEIQRILSALVSKGAPSQSLGQCLVPAVDRNLIQLVEWLIRNGADVHTPIDGKDASSKFMGEFCYKYIL